MITSDDLDSVDEDGDDELDELAEPDHFGARQRFKTAPDIRTLLALSRGNVPPVQPMPSRIRIGQATSTTDLELAAHLAVVESESSTGSKESKQRGKEHGSNLRDSGSKNRESGYDSSSDTA